MDTIHYIITRFPVNVEGFFLKLILWVTWQCVIQGFLLTEECDPVPSPELQQWHHSAPCCSRREAQPEGSHKSSQGTTSSYFSHWIILTPWRGDYTSSDVCHQWHAPATAQWVSVEWGDVRYRSRIPWCPFSVMCFCSVHLMGRLWHRRVVSFDSHLW